nr:MAG TPA: hypothetical protein [Caudoviricetes sp.]
MQEERKILEFTKSDEGISVSIEDNTQIIDVLTGIGLTLNMLIEQKHVKKDQVFEDLNEILTIIENNKEEGEKENVSK